MIVQPETEVDTAEQVARFVECLYDPSDIVEVRLLPSGESRWGYTSVIELAPSIYAEQNRAGEHIHVGLNPRKGYGGRKAPDVACARCLWADFDDTTIDAVRFKMSETMLPVPTMMVNSGHGIHAYWRLEEPITDLGAWSQWQKDLAALLGSDSSVHDPPRLTRLPGFLNHKEPPAECFIIDADPERVYALCDLHDAIPSTAQPTPTPEVPTSDRASAPCDDLSAIGRAARYAQKWEPVAEGERNSQATRHAACLTHDFALSDDQSLLLLAAWNARNAPPLPDDELRKCLQNGRKHGKHPSGEKRNHKAVEGERQLVTISANNVQPEPVRWIWKDRFAEGKLNIIVGDPNLGKTFVALDMTARITTGTPWPDDLHGSNPTGDIIVLADEDGLADTLRPRLDAAKADLNRVWFVQGVRNPENADAMEMVNLGRDLQAIEDELDRRPQTRMVVFDPLSNYLGDIESHRDTAVRAIIMPLAQLAERRGVCVLGVLHLNKTTTAKAIHRTMGSMGFIGVARCVWLVCLDPNDSAKRLLVRVKNNLAADPGGLRFQLTSEPGGTAHVEWEAGIVRLSADEALATPETKPTRTRDDVMDWLADRLASGPVLAEVMLDEVEGRGFNERTVKRAKRELGIVSRKMLHAGEKRWFWLLAGKGDNNAP